MVESLYPQEFVAHLPRRFSELDMCASVVLFPKQSIFGKCPTVVGSNLLLSHLGAGIKYSNKLFRFPLLEAEPDLTFLFLVQPLAPLNAGVESGISET